MNRRLYRCRHDRKIAGVASGVAEYFDLDPTLVRLLWFVSIFFGMVTLVLYIGMALIVPNEPLTAEEAAAEPTTAIAGHRHATPGEGHWMTYFGIALVFFGTVALLDVLTPGWNAWRYSGPLFVIGLGALLLYGATRRRPSRPTVPAMPFVPAVPTTPAPPSGPPESTTPTEPTRS